MASARNKEIIEAARTTTVKEIAARYSISPSRVCQIVKAYRLSVLSPSLTIDEKESWLAATTAVEADMKIVKDAVRRLDHNWQIRTRLLHVLEERQLDVSSGRIARAW